MGPELKQTQKLRQEIRLTLQMQQTLKMLQIARQELITSLRQEIEENPLLEEKLDMEESSNILDYAESNDEDSSEDSIYNNFQKDFSEAPYNYYSYINARTEGKSLVGQPDGIKEDRNIKLSTGATYKSLIDQLREQLILLDLPEKDREIAENIIENLDDNGYFKGESEEEDLVMRIATMTRSTEEDVLRVLKVVQGLDPPGIAARDLKECLIIQAKRCNKDSDNLIKVITNHLQDFEKKRYHVISKALNISEEEVREIEKIIKRFDPKPGASIDNEKTEFIQPDVEIYKTENGFKVRLLKDDIPKIYINRDYLNIMRRRGRDPNSKYIRDKYNSAKILLTALNEREDKIIKVAKIILNKQREFFEKGEGHLKPLLEKDIANELQCDESIVSRIFNSKYILTPYGVYPMKYFIKRAVFSKEGEDISNDIIKSMIQNMIEDEDPGYPLKDEEIARRLARQNIAIKRRTVAKYRDLLGIPSYIVRKRINNLPK